MKKVSQETLAKDLDELLKNVVHADEFLTVRTKYGEAVIISKEEWNTLQNAFFSLAHGKI